ncbi:preATP grasp domain-containing protein [Streptomyces nodosus]|uniref:preATP grasp domain-containing protein n=1 Tax=Streptomyces nodosus TaxID=40318 RepID=UPI003829CD12
MPKLLLANLGSAHHRDPEDGGETPTRSYLTMHAQRALWCAEPGDVVVLPVPVSAGFIRHVTRVLGIDRKSLSIGVAPSGEAGVHTPLGRRIRSTPFEEALLRTVRQHGVDRIWPYLFDTGMADLARRLGLDAGTAGFAFFEQGGGELLNDKATFRAMAAGIGASVPPGTVTTSPDFAEEYLWSRLADGLPAVVKQARNLGGHGNELLLSPGAEIEPLGVSRTTVVRSRTALARHLADRWQRYTRRGQDPLIIERYFPGARSLYVGLHVADDGVTSYGHGEMRMAPFVAGLAVPAPAGDQREFPVFLEQARQLGDATRSMGYRGRLSIDAVLTPSGQILLTEFNARAGGATHTHLIAERAGATQSPPDRILLDCRHRPAAALNTSLSLLAEHGLRYDQHRRNGILITVHHDTQSPPYGEFCAVADSPDAVGALAAQANALLSLPAPVTV